MSQLISNLEKVGAKLPAELLELLSSCKSYTVFDTVEQLAVAALGGAENSTFEVKYDIPGKGEFTEAIIHRVTMVFRPIIPIPTCVAATLIPW